MTNSALLQEHCVHRTQLIAVSIQPTSDIRQNKPCLEPDAVLLYCFLFSTVWEILSPHLLIAFCRHCVYVSEGCCYDPFPLHCKVWPSFFIIAVF